ncbi:helix-turn-helix transcriptional regulator [Myxococcota bacterium]|nr:helix-turn-helix transcriptional regulator [Myxococcota bacterium]
MTRSPDALAILDAAYRLEGTPEEWLRRVAAAALPSIGHGLGLHAWLVDASNPEDVRMAHPMAVGVTDEWATHWRSLWWDVFMAPLPSQTLHMLHNFSACSFAREIWDAGAAGSESYAEYLSMLAANGYGRTHWRYLRGPRAPSGDKMLYPDSFNLCSVDAEGRGCVLVANLARTSEGPVPPELAAQWARVGAHLSAALRLLRARTDDRSPSAADPFAGAEAVVAPSGRIEHAEGPATRPSAQISLRDAAVAIDRARTRTTDQSEALELWRALTSGRWTVAEQFDHDGRRYFVARPNRARVPESAALTEREEEIVRQVARGHGNKLIAYELGLSTGTVASHLASAQRKLGVRNRLELIRLVRATRPPTDEG